MKQRKAQSRNNERFLVRRLRLSCVLLCLLASCAGPKPESATQAIRWVTDSTDARISFVEVSGLPSNQLAADATLWSRLLAVYAGDVNAGLPPMAGRYEVQAGVLRFTPQFPLEPGVTYRAVFQSEQNQPQTAVFQLPAAGGASSTSVSQIYPSADVLPENLLKFYVYFSAPMSRGRIYDHIHLREASGKEVELPFLQIDEELWNPAMTRLTLLLDPGRIKRGVRPLEEVGPALQIGKHYTLAIDRAWRDGAGAPLKQGFQKSFSVGPSDREPINPKRWQIQPPTAGTQAPLSVNFTEALDHALAQRLIAVTAESGESVAGTIAIAEKERRWLFTPTDAWRGGRYRLVIQTTIEDLAGNNIGKAFDVDLQAGGQTQIEVPPVKLSFEIR